MYVVMGATGNTGSVAARKLLERGEKVRAVGRDAGKLAQMFPLGGSSAVKTAAEPEAGRPRDLAHRQRAVALGLALELVAGRFAQRARDAAPHVERLVRG